jgi:hypothetical protein
MSPISPTSVGLPPSIAVKLAIDPPSFKISERVRLSVTATSNASDPITIFNWPNIFNPSLSQMRGSLVAFDKATHEELILHTMVVKRGPVNYTLGGSDDEFFVTLEPGKPAEFSTPFGYGHTTLPGHQYLVDLQEGESVDWWKKGRKEDVLNLPGKDRGASRSDGEPIVLSLNEPVEYKLLPLEN